MGQAEAESPASKPNRARVLVVDDEDDVRRMLVRVMQRAQHDTTEAASGRDAVKLVREQPFDLVISDVQMPDKDGVELLQELHEIDADLPVLLLSGAPDLSTAMKAIEFGALEYLTKPVGPNKLLSSAARAIELCRKRREERDDLRQFRSGKRPRAPQGATARDVRPGTLLGGRYRVGRLLGEGGMGTVYEAVREDLARMRVAVKVLHRRDEGNVEYLARFRREAETVAAINHPNIVRIFDFQAQDGEAAFLVMELLEGTSLGQAISLDGPFTQRRTAFIGSQVLAALAAAHRANVVHRDLKPDNVFLTSMSGLEDIVKLLDFGIVKVLETPGEQKLTQTGAILGTPAYMAPELARGADIDARADIYAVGCILYEALTGRAPFESDNYNALLFAINHSEPPNLYELRPDLDAAFTKIIMTAMAKDPNARFQTADAMMRALGPWSNSTPSHRPPPSSAPIAFAPTMLPPSDEPPRKH